MTDDSPMYFTCPVCGVKVPAQEAYFHALTVHPERTPDGTR